MNSRLSVFLSYYRPYRRTLVIDLCCAFLVVGITLAFPLSALREAVVRCSSPAGVLSAYAW